MIIKTTKDGSLYTDCSYQHNLAITCGECTTERISKALKRFEQGKRSAQEGVSIGDLSELPFAERESYIRGYVAGIPATSDWQAIKDANIARINKSFYSYLT